MKKVIGKKAEWLKGDGEAWISFRKTLTTTTINHIKCRLDRLYLEDYVYKPAFRIGGDVRIWRFSDRQDSLYIYFLYKKTGNIYIITIPNPQEGTIIDLYNDSAEVNEQVYDGLVFEQNTPSWNVCLFSSGQDVSSINDSFSISVFDITTTLARFSLTPLVLTTDIPSYLASDNKPHYQGECGMWDSVSEKFYGNANSVGAFSLENELDEYVEVDLTGITINGKYQRVSVENTEIPRLMHDGKEVRAMIMNNKIVWKKDIASLYETDFTQLLTAAGAAFFGQYFKAEIDVDFTQGEWLEFEMAVWRVGSTQDWVTYFSTDDSVLYPGAFRVHTMQVSYPSTGYFAITNRKFYHFVIKADTQAMWGKNFTYQLSRISYITNSYVNNKSCSAAWKYIKAYNADGTLKSCYLPALSVLNEVGMFDIINLKFASMKSDSYTQHTASLTK